jgi:hypothetical protein
MRADGSALSGLPLSRSRGRDDVRRGLLHLRDLERRAAAAEQRSEPTEHAAATGRKGDHGSAGDAPDAACNA